MYLRVELHILFFFVALRIWVESYFLNNINFQYKSTEQFQFNQILYQKSVLRYRFNQIFNSKRLKLSIKSNFVRFIIFCARKGLKISFKVKFCSENVKNIVFSF